ncbi:tetratricopeptide repeat protein 41-like [Watersipora subatra]|uniref:tetratricopeptide repeat protein 41-like n=1 Tax=Watersipora subatra TaxID=2589382 RepID=UPI00355C2066
MPSNNISRHINPFLCSTDDFSAEREFLKANAFAKLECLCSHRGVSFQPYDWDHNIGEDRLHQGLSLQLALKCIGYASPYFIAFLSNQYGVHRPENSAILPDSVDDLPPDADWIDRSMVIASEHGYKWLLDESYTSTSLTELKIIQAAFLNEEAKFCRFYVRDDESSVGLQSDLGQYDKYKLQQLKTNIAKRGLFVSYYKSLEHLDELVMADWTSIIDLVYPSVSRESIGVELEIDAIHHKVFGEKRCEHLVMHPGMTKCFKQLTDFATKENTYSYDPSVRAKQFERSTGTRLLREGRKQTQADNLNHVSVFVVTGPRGCGKTSLVSAWLENESFLPGTVVVRHYAACNRMARDIAVFMKRCITELRRAFDAKYETFLASLALGPCLLVFDGLDEVAASTGHSMLEVSHFFCSKVFWQ